ncbi:MAG: ECF-type sigma factor [Phycisphaerales bacterium]
MTHREPGTVTKAINALHAPPSGALDEAHRQIYAELQCLATRERRGEAPGRTVNTTALVHEAYLRLTQNGAGPWDSRWHFYGSAASAMRRILVDAARRRGVHARALERIAVTEEGRESASINPDVLALDEALSELETIDPRLAEVVMLRYFAGLSVEETAETMETSARTVKRDWRAAKAWLYRRLASGLDPDDA